MAAEEAKRQEEQAVANQAMQQTEVPETQFEATDSVASPATPNTPVQNVTENITVQPTTPVAPPANPGSGSNTGGATSTPGGNTSGGSTPAPAPAPIPEAPYALNPYSGSGTFYSTYEAAVSAARQNLEANGYNIVTEFWSDGSEKYFLEFY
ncbi:hypothetical protein [Enterococcus faecium]|uniref:hypothetical protein n=1 Tax=Enterococcus faecium TaxID=1352 RepID=UPI002157FD9E|nr:hypothetical protein [Enterococcus faecium]